MQQRLRRGEEAALGELYDRFALLVHGLAQRIVGDERAADQITREVFGHIWENPDAYDPRDGNMRSWIATLTQRQSVKRLRTCEAELVGHGRAAVSGAVRGTGSGRRTPRRGRTSSATRCRRR